jgi:hypothetical protein
LEYCYDGTLEYVMLFQAVMKILLMWDWSIVKLFFAAERSEAAPYS